jgi:hypothetical protein
MVTQWSGIPERVAEDYQHQSALARALAEEHFDARKGDCANVGPRRLIARLYGPIGREREQSRPDKHRDRRG